jgi:hypothetical protein
MTSPSPVETRDFMVNLLKSWERTPANQSAAFNDNRITEQMQWDAKKVRLVREHCVGQGWIQYQFEGAKDYTLTPTGLASAREARRKVSLSL